MGLVRGQAKRLDVPGEPGQWVEIKKLPWGLLDGAREARTKAVIEGARLWGPDMISAINSGRERSDVQAAAADPYNEFDRGFLLRHAVLSWSYDAALPDGVEDLEEETAEWLKREIVDFNSSRRTEAEQLDGISPSISR